MEDETTWLTPEAHRKLTKELDYLVGEGRGAMSERLAEARSHGDIRENADYEAAKNEQGLMEARIRKLKYLLEHSEIRDVVQTERVEIGTVVTVVDEDGDAMDLFVAPHENRVDGYVLASPTSPLGRAILGATVGDKVAYEAPGGSFRVTVQAIRPFEG